MSRAVNSANGGAPFDHRREATIDGLTVALSRLRQGVTALKAENQHLRAEVRELRTAVQGGNNGEASLPEVSRLAEIALPAGSTAPRAARQFIAHCLARFLVSPILHDTQLLVSELVTNCLRHGDLGERDAVLVRIHLAAEILRVEIENPGTAGVVALKSPDPRAGRGFGLQLLELVATHWGVSRGHNTTVWFEMART
jgi:anti-sigma regulatory factor (Ser/Thr protein kinase)